MSDVARHASVSVATVSRVINGTGQVSDETRHRVLVALDSLGYDRPPQLRAANSPLIGIIVPELITSAIVVTTVELLARRRVGAAPCPTAPDAA